MLKFVSVFMSNFDIVSMVMLTLTQGMGKEAILYVCVLLSLPPANEVCEGYVFTGVCLFTGGGGKCKRKRRR